MSLLLNPYGICPVCAHRLVYNPKRELIECSDPYCTFTREYSSQDRENINLQASEEFERLMKWDAVYSDTHAIPSWEGKVVHPGLSQSEGNAPDGNALDKH